MIDTHSHLNFVAFQDDWQQVVGRAIEAGVHKILVVGTDPTSSQRAVELATLNDHLFAGVGIHPHHAKKYREDPLAIDDDLQRLEELAQHPRAVAIGEIGLDYHVYANSSKYADVTIDEDLKTIQRDLFERQLQLAGKYQKPVIVHSRKVKREALEIIMTHQKLEGVFHCFEGSKQFAKAVLEAGLHVSFTGNITYEQGRGEVAKLVPLDRLLLETDCPYMLPLPDRDRARKESVVLRSEPRHVKIIGQFHAALRGISAEEVYQQTTANAERLFGL